MGNKSIEKERAAEQEEGNNTFTWIDITKLNKQMLWFKSEVLNPWFGDQWWSAGH